LKQKFYSENKTLINNSTDTFEVLKHAINQSNCRFHRFNRYIWSIETQVPQKTQLMNLGYSTDTFEVLKLSFIWSFKSLWTHSTDTFEVLKHFKDFVLPCAFIIQPIYLKYWNINILAI